MEGSRGIEARPSGGTASCPSCGGMLRTGVISSNASGTVWKPDAGTIGSSAGTRVIARSFSRLTRIPATRCDNCGRIVIDGPT